MPPRASASTSTPGRRVTRASSRTPGPSLPALPALAIRQSHAYGAPGKTTLHSQLATDNADLAALMESRISPEAARSLSESPPEDEPAEDDLLEEVTVASQDARNATALTPKAPYAESLISRTSDPNTRAELNNNLKNAKTHPKKVFQRAAQRFVPRFLLPSHETNTAFRFNTIGNAFRSFLAIVFLVTLTLTITAVAVYGIIIPLGLLLKFAGDIVTLGVATLAPLPSRFDVWREATISQITKGHKVAPFNVPPADLESTWNAFKHQRLFAEQLPKHNLPETQWSINVNFLERLEQMERKVDGIVTQARLHNDTMTLIHNMLPHLMVVERRDGTWEIPEKFWRALMERLGAKNEEASDLWRKFLTSNDQQIEKLNGDAASTAVQQALNNKLIVSREMVEDALRKNYAALQDIHATGLAEVEQRILRNAKHVAESTSKELIERTPAHQYAKMQAQSLAYTNILVNTREAMQEFNYFNPGLGASINYRLTSPTQRKNDALLPRMYGFLAGNPENPPQTALVEWHGPTDCWCASPSSFGKAQISIDLQNKIYPARLIVEHLPASGTLNIAAAPRKLEVWARTPSKEDAQRLKQYIVETTAQAEHEECSTAPTDRHVCIGKGKYDIHMDNWVQAFTFFANTAEMGFATDNIIVRVTKNWGANHTCLYRLRLTGSHVY